MLLNRDRALRVLFPSIRQRLVSILRLECPRCLRGKVYEGFLQYHSRCPCCEVEFEREPGFFIGSYYFSYAIAVVLGAPLAVALSLSEISALGFVLIVGGVLTLLSPFIVKYARVAWLHFDDHCDPRE